MKKKKIDIDKDTFENIDIDIDSDSGILQNIDIDKSRIDRIWHF